MLPTYEQAGGAYASPIIWADCPVRAILEDPSYGHYHFSDFINNNIVADTSVDGWEFVGTNPDIDYLATVEGGVCDLATSGADNDQAYLNSQTFTQFNIGSERKIWMEMRVKLGTLTDYGFIFGLAEQAFLDIANTDMIVDGAASLATESFIGFEVLSGTPTTMDFVYQLDDGAQVEPFSDVTDTVVTATWYKIGFKFDGMQTVEAFVDGVSIGTFTIAPSTFPNDVAMGAVTGIKAGSGVAYNEYIDWIRIASERG